MGNYDSRAVKFRQSPSDFPCMVELGGKVPAWGLSRWGSGGIRFRPPDDEGFTRRENSRQLLYRGRNRSHRFTILGPDFFEYDCILNREPDSNSVSIALEGADQFDFFKQPDFIKDPFLAGSYAVYKKETYAGEGTGKLCHIHRPKVIDARGRWVWGDLSVTGDRLVITIPEDWLGEASYPVVVDPTIGTSTVGSQTSWYDPDSEEMSQLFVELSQAVNRFRLGEALSGNATAYVYAYSNASEAGCRPVLYGDYNDIPYNRISTNEGYFDVAVSGSKPASWRSASFGTGANRAAGEYVWFGFAAVWFAPRFDYGQKCYKYWLPDDSVDDLPATFELYSAGEYYDFKLSAYFSYSAEQNFIRTLTQGVRPGDSGKAVGVYQRTAPETAGSSTALGRFEGFYRKVVFTLGSAMILKGSPTFVRRVIEYLSVTMGVYGSRDLFRGFLEGVKAAAVPAGSRGFFRKAQEGVTGTDGFSFPVLFLRRLPETAAATEATGHWGAYVRGLLVEAGSLAETWRGGEYYRKQDDTVAVEGVSLRSLFIFIRLLTTGLVRDFIINRLLKSNEDVSLKSAVCRELEIESRI